MRLAPLTIVCLLLVVAGGLAMPVSASGGGPAATFADQQSETAANGTETVDEAVLDSETHAGGSKVGPRVSGGTVVVVSEPGRTDAVAAAVSNAGGVTDTIYRDHVYVRDLPNSGVDDLAASDAVRHIRTPANPRTHSHGGNTSEGVVTMNATDLHAANVTGAGKTVAVIDTGFDPEAPPIAEQIVQTRDFGSGFSTDHGTAMAEVVSDVAPQANLVLVSVGNEMDVIKAADWIESETDADIVVTGVGFYPVVGPLDGTDVLSQRIEESVSRGLHWIGPAGNAAGQHWQTEWTDPHDDGRLSFDPDGRYFLDLPPTFGDGTIYVTWDEDWADVDHQYRIWLTADNPDCTEVTYHTTLPYERIDLGFGSGLDCQTSEYSLEVEAIGEADHDQRFNFFFTGLSVPSEVDITSTSSLTIPGTSEDVVTVSGYDVRSGTLSFGASRGPTVDGRDGVDMLGPTNVQSNTSVLGFGGTSAAAAHVAGATALIGDANADLSAAESHDRLVNASTPFFNDPTLEGAGTTNVFRAYDSLDTYTVDRCQTLTSDGTYHVSGTLGPDTSVDAPGPHLLNNTTVVGAPEWNNVTRADTLYELEPSNCLTVLSDDLEIRGAGATITGTGSDFDTFTNSDGAIGVGGPDRTIIGDRIRPAGEPLSNVTVSGVTVEDWQFGVRSMPDSTVPVVTGRNRTDNLTIDDIGVVDTRIGVDLRNASSPTITGIDVTETFKGIRARNIEDFTLADSSISTEPEGSTTSTQALVATEFTNVTISGTEADSYRRAPAVELQNGTQATIQSSHFEDDHWGALLTSETSGVTIADTVLAGRSWSYVSAADSGDVAASNVTLDAVDAHLDPVEPVEIAAFAGINASISPAGPGVEFPDDEHERVTTAFNVTASPRITGSIGDPGGLNVTVPYDPAGVDEASIRLWRYHRETGQWGVVPGYNEPDTDANTITANISTTGGTEFGDYAAFGAAQDDDGDSTGIGRFDREGNGKIDFQDVLNAVQSFNDGETVDGASVDFTDVLNVIEAFNTQSAV